MSEFSPSPGFVLKLSRKQFEELVEDAINQDISELKGSNGNRLKQLLKLGTDDQVNSLIAALRAS